MPCWQSTAYKNCCSIYNITAPLVEKLQERHRLSSLDQGLTPFPARADVLSTLLYPQVSPCSSFLAARLKSFAHSRVNRAENHFLWNRYQTAGHTGLPGFQQLSLGDKPLTHRASSDTTSAGQFYAKSVKSKSRTQGL